MFFSVVFEGDTKGLAVFVGSQGFQTILSSDVEAVVELPLEGESFVTETKCSESNFGGWQATIFEAIRHFEGVQMDKGHARSVPAARRASSKRLLNKK